MLALTALFVVVCRVRLLEVPLERDEGEYAYVGQQILRGVPPFESIYHVKLPGIHAVYAVIEALFGETQRGIRLGLLLVNLATIGLLFALAKRLFGPLAAAVSAACFSLLSLSQETTGFSANAEHFVLLPAVAGLLALVVAQDSRREAALLFAAGLGLGLATAIKQPGVFFVAAGATLLLARWIAERPRAPGRLVRTSACYGLGVALPLAALCAIFLGLGLFERFWFWTWIYPRSYVSQFSWADGWGNFLLSFAPEGPRRGVLDPFWPLLLLAALGLGWLLWARRGRETSFTLVLLLFSGLAVATGLHFFPHYYLLAAPALALLAGAGALAIAAGLGRAAALAAAALVVGFAIHAERAYLFTLEPLMVSRTAFGGNPFPESVEIAAWLEAHSAPEDRIAVLGSEPQIYFHARRRAATGYLYTYEMLRDHPFVRDFQAEMAREVEAAEPRYVVMVNISASWQPSRLAEPDRFIFEWAERFLREHYRQVGVVEIRWPQQKYGHFCWDGPERSCRPPRAGPQLAPLWIGIHERLSRPAAAP